MEKDLFILILILAPVCSLSQTVSYKVVLERQLSSEASDMAPRLFGDNSQMILSSTRGNEQNEFGFESRSNLYYSVIENNIWTDPIPLINVDKSSNFGVVTFDTQRNILIYTECPRAKGKVYSCHIVYSFLEGDLIGESIPLELSGNGAASGIVTMGHPFFSNALDVLFFVSNMSGGYGGMDIWFSTYDRETDSWGDPRNAGPEVNTVEDDMFPFVAEDGTLYFSSDGHGGFGKWDIYKAEYKNNYEWGSVYNLGEPINSDLDDFGIYFTTSDRGYFSSNRMGGLGDDDIYEFCADTSEMSHTTSMGMDARNKTARTLSEIFNKEECDLMNEEPEVLMLELYPNPNDGRFTFKFNCPTCEQLTLRVFSNLGVLLSVENIEVIDGGYAEEFLLNEVGSGIYYVQIMHGCEILRSAKVVINK